MRPVLLSVVVGTGGAHPPRRRLATLAATATLAAAGALGGAAVAHAVGIDVSQWQHNPSVNWDRAGTDRVTFAFIKATEGLSYTNPHYAADRVAARRAGIYRGAYHFARPSRGSAARQARYFVDRAGEHDANGDLPPVLDLEDTGGLGTADLRTWTRRWLETVQSLTGRAPVIYTSPSFWEGYLGDSRGFRGYPLWVAHYETTRPQVPGGWKSWTFWQTTNTGHVAGIIGAVDINRFNGTHAELAALAQADGAGGDDREVPGRRAATTTASLDGGTPQHHGDSTAGPRTDGTAASGTGGPDAGTPADTRPAPEGASREARTLSLYRLVDGSTERADGTRTNTVAPAGQNQVLVRPSGIEAYRAVFGGGVAHTRADPELVTVGSG
jgi:GH25 family lysozyme M1 (1,4-beta-N-acetylmuramidase)